MPPLIPPSSQNNIPLPKAERAKFQNLPKNATSQMRAPRREPCLNIRCPHLRLLPGGELRGDVSQLSERCQAGRPATEWCGRGEFAARPAAGRLCSFIPSPPPSLFPARALGAEDKRDALSDCTYAPSLLLGEKPKAKPNDREARNLAILPTTQSPS